MVLIAFSSHCPYHKHLEVIKVKVNKLWSICLTKYKVQISCPFNTRAAPHATQVQLPVSSCHSKYMCIIENRQRGTPCPMIRKNPHIKMTRQADNEHLSNLLIYHGNMVLFSLFPLFIISFFLFFSFFLNIGLFFYKKNASQTAHYGYAAGFHHVSMDQTSGPGVSLTHIHNSMDLQAPLSFHTDDIHIQKSMISTRYKYQVQC